MNRTHFAIKSISQALVLASVVSIIWSSSSFALPFNITYPIIGPTHFSDDYYSARSGGIHAATDVFANKMQQIVSPVDGVLTYVAWPQPSYGYMITIRDSQNYRYNFIHINNDTPGTDDGNAKGTVIYAPDMKVGNPVVKGQHIAYVGDSGNAESTASHLHFEIVRPDGSIEDPYGSLVYGNHIDSPNQYPQLSGEILPYGPGINTSLQVAMGNFGLSNNQYVTAPGAGGGPQVLVYRQDDTPVHTFLAYDSSFKGGVDVAAGDVDGDGTDEIITGTGPNSASHVRIFKPDGQVVSAFFAYPGYNTGVNVAAGDVDGDGTDEIITGTGPGWATHVKVFKANGQSIAGFFAYDGFHGGVRVSVGNVRTNTPQAEIMTSPYTEGGPDIRLFNMTGSVLAQKSMFEPWWSGGYDVAAGIGKSKVGTGENRRSTLRAGI